jgi:hypothetical protein
VTQLTSYSHTIIEAHPRGAATTSITSTTLSAQGIVTPPSSPSNSLSAGEAPSSTSLSAAVSTSSPPDAKEFLSAKEARAFSSSSKFASNNSPGCSVAEK